MGETPTSKEHSPFTPESIRAFIGDSFPGDLGIEPLEIEDSFASGRIVVDRRHLHPGGYVHGGVWTALGDTVAAVIEVKIERLRDGQEPRLAANLIVTQFVLPPRG